MPIYEYGCEACGHRFEIQQKLADAPLKKCPNCGKQKLEKLISSTAFVLKGGGWYKDGYGSGGKSSRTENQRADRLTKAIDDDKKKSSSTEKSGGSESSSSSSSSSGSTSGDSGSKKSTAPAHAG